MDLNCESATAWPISYCMFYQTWALLIIHIPDSKFPRKEFEKQHILQRAWWHHTLPKFTVCKGVSKSHLIVQSLFIKMQAFNTFQSGFKVLYVRGVSSRRTALLIWWQNWWTSLCSTRNLAEPSWTCISCSGAWGFRVSPSNYWLTTARDSRSPRRSAWPQKIRSRYLHSPSQVANIIISKSHTSRSTISWSTLKPKWTSSHQISIYQPNKFGKKIIKVNKVDPHTHTKKKSNVEKKCQKLLCLSKIKGFLHQV